jgi:hypothetical protein
MRGGNFLSRCNIALYDPPKPKDVSDFKDSSPHISYEDAGIFYQGLFSQMDKDYVRAKMIYVELLKKTYLRTNAVILHNISMCDKEIG